MTPPRTDSFALDALRFVLGAVLFTVGVCLAVVVSALLLRATIRFTEPLTDSRRISSLLALAVFVASVTGSTYLLAAGCDPPEASDGRGDGGEL